MSGERDPREIIGDLRRLRDEFEHMPKARAPMFVALAMLCDELIEWDRAMHRWAKEYDARLHAAVDAWAGRPPFAHEIRRRESER